MHPIFANTIWAPLFVHRYDTSSALTTFAAGFVAECGVLRLYTRSLLPPWHMVRRLAGANTTSYITGNFLLVFVPLDIHKSSLRETVLAFFIAYLVTLPVEFFVLRPLLPTQRSLLLRAVVMANFVSYSVLFFGYVVWFAGWSRLVRTWTGGA